MIRAFSTAIVGWLAVVELVAPSVPVLSAADDRSNYKSGWQSESRGDQWKITTWGETPNGFAQRPQEAVLRTVSVEWRTMEFDPLGNICFMRGRLSFVDDDTGEMRPVNWYQGVSIVLNKEPSTQLDWSKGVSSNNTLHGTTFVNPMGEFRVPLDLRESSYDRKRQQPFQVGLALAEHIITGEDSQKVIWKSDTPIDPAFVSMLDIPVAPELSREIDLINRASGWQYGNPNRSNLIGAVNALQALGKERALATLEKYVELTGTHYNFDQEIVFWIIRVLFEPIRLNERTPNWFIGIVPQFDDPRQADDWPLDPIAIIDDVPFMVGEQVNIGGGIDQPSTCIKWARRHGVIRDHPLRPNTNPLVAAQAILESPQIGLVHFQLRQMFADRLREQALAMAGGEFTPKSDEYLKPDEANARWKQQLRDAKDRGLHWDGSRQEFVEKGK